MHVTVVLFLFATILCIMPYYVTQDKHIQEVVEACSKLQDEVSKCTEEKMIRKINTALQNREDQLRQLIEKQKEHVSFDLVG